VTDQELKQTPVLEGLLRRLRRRLVVAVWLHGLGTLFLALSVWTLFAFSADYWLRVPAPVRLAHGAVFLVVLYYVLWRHLLRPLRRVPGRAGLAVLIERRHPEEKELLVSAAELQGAPQADETARGLVESVLARAEDRAGNLDLAGVLDQRGPWQRFAAGGLAAGAVVAGALLAPQLARIFVDHLIGRNVPWPQRTHLAVRIPLRDAAAHVEETEDLLRVRVARGTDVPVVVYATGDAPSEVVLHFDDDRERRLSPSGGNTFRTLLPAQQESLAFYATGGDDRDGLPRVEIEVLQPPDVEGVAVAVAPPPWTGLEPSVAFNRDVEVVAGSALKVHVLPSPRSATGQVRLLPDDVVQELVAAPFPLDQDDDVAPELGLAFELTASASFGFRFELVDETGLSNPDPGLFRITVVEDRAPELRVLAPARGDYDTVQGAAISVRVRAEDDFGLSSMSFEILPVDPGAEAPPAALLKGDFEPVPLPPERGRIPWLGATRVDVDSLAPPGGEVSVDQRFELVMHAADNHAPEPVVGSSAPVHIRIISADELLRRMQERLARARIDAGRLGELQREKLARVEELAAAVEPGAALEAGDDLSLHGALLGQRRVQADATTLSRDLAGVGQDMLYARLDDKAGALLAFLDARLNETSDVAFHPEVWQALTDAFERGELGTAGFTGNLVALVDLSLAISAESAQSAADELDRAQQAPDAGALLAALEAALDHQGESIRRIDVLLDSLSEWDNFQNVLLLTRDILNRQKALRDRTRHFAKEKER
jgi:hypothetical protein